jgi:AcrR family transcriptional regulator
MTMTTMQTTKRTKTKPPAQPLRLSSRDAILAAAMTSLLKNPSATIDEVVAASGVSRATVFRQFPTRTDLVRAVGVSALAGLERSLQELELELDRGDAMQRLQRLMRVLIAHGEQLHFLIVAVELYDDAEVVAASDALDRYLVPVFDDAVAAGILRADVPRAWVWSVVDAVIFAAWHEVQRGTLGREQAVELVEDTLLRGLGVHAMPHR